MFNMTPFSPYFNKGDQILDPFTHNADPTDMAP